MNKIRLRLASWILGHEITVNPEDWKLVHVQKVTNVSHRDSNGFMTTKGTAFVYFHESNLGNRKYELLSDLEQMSARELQTSHVKWDYYLKTIKVWMAGRYIDDIPGYRDVDSIDLMAKLSIRK
jgi:hypothetical protein